MAELTLLEDSGKRSAVQGMRTQGLANQFHNTQKFHPRWSRIWQIQCVC